MALTRALSYRSRRSSPCCSSGSSHATHTCVLSARKSGAGSPSKFPDLDLGRASQVKPRLGVDNEAKFSRGRPLRLLRSVQGTSWLATTRDFAPEVVEVIWDAARASPRTDPAPLRAL